MANVTINTDKEKAEKIGGTTVSGGGSIRMSLDDYAKYNASREKSEKDETLPSAITMPTETVKTQQTVSGITSAMPTGRIKTSESIANAVNKKYGKKLERALEAMTSREAFSYDPERDNVYAVYKNIYEREGEAAFRRVLNDNNTSVTGASGAVLSEAIAARNSELKKLTDIIPELAGDAYKRYISEGERLSDEIKTIAGLYKDEYDRQYKANRDAYSDLADMLSIERSERHWNAEQEQQKLENERNAESDLYKNALSRINAEMANIKLGYYPSIIESEIVSGIYKTESDALNNALARGFYTRSDEAALPWLSQYRTSDGYSISTMLTEAAYTYQKEYNKKRANINAIMGW